MIREIKFRAWAFGGMGDSFNPFDPEFLSTGGTFDKDTIFMQFTGLLDKNGKEIFEGDLFQVANNVIYVIKYFVESENNFEKAYGCFCLTVPEKITIPIDEWAIKNGQIIGNIYENPELLKTP